MYGQRRLIICIQNVICLDLQSSALVRHKRMYEAFALSRICEHCDLNGEILVYLVLRIEKNYINVVVI